MEVKLLKWDSDFFGFSVGQVAGNPRDTDFEGIYADMAAKDIRLAYCSADVEISCPEHPLYNAQLIDVKVTYLKEIVSTAPNENVQAYNKKNAEEKLISLAVESGVYSRFKKDKAIPVAKYEELYKLWIVNSVNKKMAEEVLVYKVGEEIGGFVTVGVKNGNAELGIMAVDPQWRGRGIASALMKCAENYMWGKNKMIQIVTQQDNIAACRLYERFGYVVVNTVYVYHIWRK